MTAFDGITYNKGQALIRMLESYLGEEVFRDGIRAYMAAHAYGNTTTADLWRALEAAPAQAGGRHRRVLYRTGRRAADRRRDHVQRRRAAHDVAAGSFHDRAGGRRTKRTLRRVAAQLAGTGSAVGAVGRGAPCGRCRAAARRRPRSAAGRLRRADQGQSRRHRLLPGRVRRRRAARRWRKRCRMMAPADRVNFLADSWAMVQAGAPNRHPISRWSRTIGVDDRRAVWDQVIRHFCRARPSGARPARTCGAAGLRARKSAPDARPARLGRQRPAATTTTRCCARSLIRDARRTRRRGNHGGGEAAVRGLSAEPGDRCRRRCAMPSPMSSASAPDRAKLRHAADAGAQEHR